MELTIMAFTTIIVVIFIGIVFAVCSVIELKKLIKEQKEKGLDDIKCFDDIDEISKEPKIK